MSALKRAALFLADHPIRSLLGLMAISVIVAPLSPNLDAKAKPHEIAAILIGAACWLLFPFVIIPIYFVRGWKARNAFGHKRLYLFWLFLEAAFFAGLLAAGIYGMIR